MKRTVDSQLLEQVNGLHGNHDTGAVVEGSGAQVPGVEVAGDDDHLFGVLSSLPVGDDVEAFGVGESLRGEGEVQRDRALAGEVLEQVGVFCGDGGGGNLGHAVGILGEAGMGKAKIRSPNRAHQHGHRARGGSGNGASAAVDHPPAVGVEAAALGGQLLVEFVVEEQDLAFHRALGEGGKLLPVVHDDDLGGKAFRGRGHAAAQGGKDDFLGDAGRLTGPGNHFSRLQAAHPVRDLGLFERDFRAQGAHFGGHVVHGLLGLRRAAQAGADIVGEMAQFGEGVGVLKGGITQALHGSQLLGGPGAFAACHHGVEAVEKAGRGRRRSILGGAAGGCQSSRQKGEGNEAVGLSSKIHEGW